MDLKDIKIGFGLTGSFCTIPEILPQIENLVKSGAIVYPIISDSVNTFDTRFGKRDDLIKNLKEITCNEIISTIPQAEPIGPKGLLDIMVIAPCTGNTLAKLANSITDTTVTMAAKAHLRNEKPLIISVSTNDGLGGSGKNIGLLLNSKNIYFVPYNQDDPANKTKSLIGKSVLIKDTIMYALNGKQLQPVIYR